jgi:hypothetical protein
MHRAKRQKTLLFCFSVPSSASLLLCDKNQNLLTCFLTDATQPRAAALFGSSLTGIREVANVKLRVPNNRHIDQTAGDRNTCKPPVDLGKSVGFPQRMVSRRSLRARTPAGTANPAIPPITNSAFSFRYEYALPGCTSPAKQTWNCKHRASAQRPRSHPEDHGRAIQLESLIHATACRQASGLRHPPPTNAPRRPHAATPSPQWKFYAVAPSFRGRCGTTPPPQHCQGTLNVQSDPMRRVHHPVHRPAQPPHRPTTKTTRHVIHSKPRRRRCPAATRRQGQRRPCPDRRRHARPPPHARAWHTCCRR